MLLYLAQEGRGIGLLNKLQGLQAPGRRAGHRRRQPRARAAGRPARLRHRRADPRRPRPRLDPDHDQQPEEDHRARGLRPVGHRAGPDPARAQPAQRALPRRQAHPPRPHAAPPGPARSTRRCSTPSTSTTATPAGQSGPRSVTDASFAIAVGRFYEDLAERLVAGAQRAFDEAGAAGRGPRRARRLRAAARRALPRADRPLRRASPASARSSAARPTTTTTSATRRRAGSRTCSCAPACRARSAC